VVDTQLVAIDPRLRRVVILAFLLALGAVLAGSLSAARFGAAQKITDTPGFVAVTPDGRFVVSSVVSQGSGFGIALTDRLTGKTSDAFHAPGNVVVIDPVVSGDANYVAFATEQQLSPDDTNNGFDVYVVDTHSGALRRASVDASGNQAAHGIGSCLAYAAAISPNGRFVYFSSTARDLIPNDKNGSSSDIFEKDMKTGRLRIVSATSTGRQLPEAGLHGHFGLSADGRMLVFAGWPIDRPRLRSGLDRGFPIKVVYEKNLLKGTLTLVPEPKSTAATPDWVHTDATGRHVVFGFWAYHSEQIYVSDVVTGRYKLVTVTGAGNPANAWSFKPSISGNARYVAFTSQASNLAPSDSDHTLDIFIRDLQRGTTKRILGGPPYDESTPEIALDNRGDALYSYQAGTFFLPVGS
jgi:Tol biopolymer transport system component